MQVKADRRDEAGKLLGSMKNMVDKWRGVISQITETASRLSSAATEAERERGADVERLRRAG